MDRRAILALVLMSLVMLVWMIFVMPKTQKPGEGQEVTQTEEGSPQTTDQSQVAPTDTDTTTIPLQTTTDIQASTETRLAQLAEAPRVHIDTPLYSVEMAESTGTITQWTMHSFKKRNGHNGEVVDLIPRVAEEPAIGSRCLELTSRTIRGLEKATWTLEQASDSKLIFTTQLGNIELTKTLEFKQDQYVADVTVNIANLADTPQPVDYSLHWGPGIADDNPKWDQKKTGPVVLLHQNVEKDKPIRDSKRDAPVTGRARWAGMQSKYFAAILIPHTSFQPEYRRQGTQGEGIPYIAAPYYEVMLENQGLVLGAQGAAGATLDHHYRLYVGPKVSDLLGAVEIPGAPEEPSRLKELNDLGIFGLANLMLWLINGLHSLVGNYGIAILLLTTIIKLALYPLTQMSYRSTKKMQTMQPLMTEIRQKYRDDAQKMNKAMMRLYKEHGINPMGGCLPMLPQMPIFFSLFYAVRDAAEMRSAVFVWIQDLSLPDTIFRIAGIGINPLPLAMGVSMFWQQSMAGTGATDANQAKFMKYLPILFTFFFYNMPSGLVLYWFWNNVLTIGQQYIINRTHDFNVPVPTDSQKKQKRT